MRSRGSSPASRHGRKKSTDGNGRPSSAGHQRQPRPSLIPPDIVLLSEDQETHEPLTTTLVSGQSCNDVIMSYEQMKEDDRRGKTLFCYFATLCVQCVSTGENECVSVCLYVSH